MFCEASAEVLYYEFILIVIANVQVDCKRKKETSFKNTCKGFEKHCIWPL